MKTTLQALSPEEKAGQLFFPAAFINDTDEQIRQIEDLITNHHIGGLTFFHSRASAATNYEKKVMVSRNDHSYERLQELIRHYQSVSKTPLLISIDAEWGLAMRVENTPQYPYALTLGALSDEAEALIEAVGFQTGKDLKRIGIDFNLAPVADINDNPNNPVIGYRSFGQNREQVVRRAAAFLRGQTRAGVLGCLKHFPGHGNTNVDSHLGLPQLDRSSGELFENELYSFKRLIAEGGVDSVMVGHLMVPALSKIPLPATLNPELIRGLLRETLGFNGLVISDALNMRSVSNWFETPGDLELAAFKAGNDILCFSEHVGQGVEQILENGSAADLNQAVERILALKEKAGLFHQKDLSPVASYGDFSHCRELNRSIAEEVITKVQSGPTAEIRVKALFTAGQAASSHVSDQLQQQHHLHPIDLNEEVIDMDELLQLPEEIALVLYPPRVKPMDHFGFSAPAIENTINLLKHKKAVVFLMGNPYVLQELAPYAGCATWIVGYQSFPEFEEQALRVYRGEIKANGQLPVKISSFSYR